MKDDSDYRSLTPKDGWLKKTCERCKGDFWLAPGQFNNILFCKDECRHEPPEVRFLKSVTKDGPMHLYDASLGCCWNSKFTPSAPYPSMKVKGVQIRVARFVLELTLGRPIAEGMEASHTCNNSRCVNPDHIKEWTHQQNIQYQIECGRKAMGEQAGPSKLTVEQVKEIKLLKGQVTLKVAAAKYNVVIHTIWAIWIGKTWKDV